MHTVNIHEAKTHLSRLIAEIGRGEEVVIAKGGKPVARLVPYGPTGQERRFGKDAGLFEVPDDFDEPLPAQVLAGFME
ncbi:MAG: type II toxin-antitoxin system Phd/YefM family antitoxin [Chromatiales bacterium]|nr:type II toxin-antitoxin system Phd/YefM family antitoxin [Gammaproteobacteria bacterium]MCP5352094.1 type II toxin-antitoxin system Phd/YefM family antitoxin [Chromatiales bacterium]